MKIIRQNKTDYTKEELRRIQANKDCNICPNCGEDKPYYMDGNGKWKGVHQMLFTVKHRRFLKVYYTDPYICYSCGCEWESDLY